MHSLAGMVTWETITSIERMKISAEEKGRYSMRNADPLRLRLIKDRKLIG
jgi:hypothetical protein